LFCFPVHLFSAAAPRSVAHSLNLDYE